VRGLAEELYKVNNEESQITDTQGNNVDNLVVFDQAYGYTTIE